MRRVWIVGGILAVALAASVAVAEARGPGGYGMMGPRTGMMGQGGYGAGMMGQGACGAGAGVGAGVNYDPAAMATREEAMLTQMKSALTALQTQLSNAADEQVKAALQTRIERQNLMIAWHEAKLPVIKSLPTDWLQGALTMANADVDFFSKATATDAYNKAWIESQLAWSKARVTNLQAQVDAQAKAAN